MLRITHSILLLSVIGCLVGCGSREEDAADGGQPAQRYRAEYGVPEPEHSRECEDTREVPPVTIAPLSIMTPVLNVDPFHRWHKALAEFIIKNPADIPQTVSTLTLDFGQLCPVLETVALTGPTDILSDGGCREQVEFTIDTELAAHEELPVALWGISKTGFESALASVHLKRMGPQPGIRPVKLMAAGQELLPDSWSIGPPIIVRDFMKDDEQECYENDDDMDPNTIEVSFSELRLNQARTVQNRIFLVPFHVHRASPESSTSDITFHVRLESEHVRLLAGQVISADNNSLVSQVVVNDDVLTVLIPASYANLYTRYQLLLYAPGERGVIRFAILEDDITCETGSTLVGCYPGFSDPYLVLPPDEWEELQ